MHFWNIHIPSLVTSVAIGLVMYGSYRLIKKVRNQDDGRYIMENRSGYYSGPYGFGIRASQSPLEARR